MIFRRVILFFVMLLPVANAQEPEAVARKQPAFGLDNIQFLQRELGGYPLWQYTASLLWVIAAFFLAMIVDYLMTHQLRRLAAKTKTDLDEKLIAVLHKPVKFAVFLALLNVGIHTFYWPEWMEKILSTLFIVAVAGTIIYLIMRIVDLLVEYATTKFFANDADLAKMMLPLLGKSLKVFVCIIGVLTVAQSLGIPITSVLAGLGVGGIAVALAAQNTLANVFGSITILTDRPFRVGDRVQIAGHDGMVETIGLRSTRLRTLEGHLVTIPNKIVADSAINNITLRPNIRQLITLNLTYGTTAEKMQEGVNILRDIFKAHPLTHDAWIYWKDFGAHSQDIFIVYWCKTTVYKEFLEAMQAINLQIKERFTAAGLDFAFPTQTIHLEQPALPQNSTDLAGAQKPS